MRGWFILLFICGFLGRAWTAGVDPKATKEADLHALFEQSQDRSRQALRDREEKRRDFLEFSGLRGVADTCVAYAIATGECAISVTAFERGLVSQIPDSLEFLTRPNLKAKALQARQVVLEHLVDRAFLKGYGSEAASAPELSSDTVASSEGRGLPKRILADRPIARRDPAGRAGVSGIPNGIDILTLLRAFPEIRSWVVAATDSAWLQSRLNDANSEGRLSPVTVPAWRLPDSIAHSLARSRMGEWTPIRKTRFGFLSCTWLDTLPPSQVLAEIQTRVLAAEARTQKQARGQAQEHLRKHPEECRDSDTLPVSIRLMPPMNSRLPGPGPAWMTVPSTALPPEVERLLRSTNKGTPTDTVGPVRSLFGTWTLTLNAPRPRLDTGDVVDSLRCFTRIESGFRQIETARRIRSEWELMASKPVEEDFGEVRITLLERLSGLDVGPEAAYFRMRGQWVTASLRFTHEVASLDALSIPPENRGK